MNRCKAISIAVCVFSVLLCSAQEKLYPNEFSLADVQLLNGPFRHARDLNIKVLLEYKPDRLLAPYLKEAALTPKDSSFSNWDGLDGHVGGHYLSAMAINAANGNIACRERMNYMLDELEKCQQSNNRLHPVWGKGYVGGVPNSSAVWSGLLTGDMKAFNKAWVPWYNVHKMYAGLRDAWLYTNSEKAKQMFLRFCDWGIYITRNLSDSQMQKMLDTEHGGINEIFADAYQMTGDGKYLATAKRFSHHMLLDPMSASKDNLDNKHANTQVPKAIGFERIGELSGDKKYLDAGNFFWQTVVKNRSLAFGGNSRREHFPAAAACTDFIDDVEGPESCNSYNMLKLTQDLFRLQASVPYVDYFERTLYNHILSTQHPGHGGYVYFTPARPRHYKVYSAPNEAMWCCVGSGMENHGKYNAFIYTHQHDSLLVNLFIPSALNWHAKKIKLEQQTDFPYEEKTRIIVTDGAAAFRLLIRYPSWVDKNKLAVKINGKAILVKAMPSSYISINRAWKKGDTVEVELPMRNSIEQLPNVPAYVAFLHGPVLLSAKTGTQQLEGLVADNSRWGHIASGKKLPIDKAPIIVADDLLKLASNLIPVPGKRLQFSLSNVKLVNPNDVLLEPFYGIHDARYMMYWMALSNTGYTTYVDSVANLEKQRLLLQERTVDAVATGEQQPEVDHAMESSQSKKGNYMDEFFREASNGGYFSYRFATAGNSNLALQVRYWGAEWGNRKIEIYVDDELLVAEDNTGRWNTTRFQTVTYNIPSVMLFGKDHIRVKFQSLQGSTAGAVYHVRLLKN